MKVREERAVTWRSQCVASHILPRPDPLYCCRYVGGKLDMKIWKIAALVALATIPLLLISQKKKAQEPVFVDSDNIFENELSSD